MSFDKGFDFRSTSGYVTDPTNCTYVLHTDVYPTVRNSSTFGWDTVIQSRDRDNTAGNEKVAGINFNVTPSTNTFQVDLPASGDYDISLGVGDPTASGKVGQILIKDGGTTLITISHSGTGLIYDANDASFSTLAGWVAGQTSKRVTFTGTTLTAVMSSGSDVLGIIAHLFVSQVIVAGSQVPVGPLGQAALLRTAAQWVPTYEPQSETVGQPSNQGDQPPNIGPSSYLRLMPSLGLAWTQNWGAQTHAKNAGWNYVPPAPPVIPSGFIPQPEIPAPNWDGIQSESGPWTSNGLQLAWTKMQQGITQDLPARLRQNQQAVEPDVASFAPTVDQNNLMIGRVSLVLFTGSSSVNVTGFQSPDPGKQRMLFIHNTGSGTITLKNESASSLVGNRIHSKTGSDITLATDASTVLAYLSGRYRQIV